MAKHWVLGTLLCGLLGSAPAYADKVVWLSAEFPPLSMPGNPQSEQGYMDNLLRQVQLKMPQHHVQQEIVPWPRALLMAQRGGAYCTALAVQTPEREAFLRFTSPYGYVYPVGVVIRARDAALFKPLLNKEGELNLELALRNTSLTLGVAGSRSYGTMLDNTLAPLIAAAPTHIKQIRNDNSTKSLLAMLQRSRFDYTLAYPSEMVYYSGSSQDAMRFYPVAGNSDLLPGRFSCTRTPLTDRIFEDLSRLAIAQRSNPNINEAYERWLPHYLIKTYRLRLAVQLANSP